MLPSPARLSIKFGDPDSAGSERRAGGEQAGQLLVRPEEVLDPLAVRIERLLAVTFVLRLIERAMDIAQVLRHDVVRFAPPTIRAT